MAAFMLASCAIKAAFVPAIQFIVVLHAARLS
jgi:hypothetical protein